VAALGDFLEATSAAAPVNVVLFFLFSGAFFNPPSLAALFFGFFFETPPLAAISSVAAAALGDFVAATSVAATANVALFFLFFRPIFDPPSLAAATAALVIFAWLPCQWMWQGQRMQIEGQQYNIHHLLTSRRKMHWRCLISWRKMHRQRLRRRRGQQQQEHQTQWRRLLGA
jgi:hypothetical protein